MAEPQNQSDSARRDDDRRLVVGRVQPVDAMRSEEYNRGDDLLAERLRTS